MALTSELIRAARMLLRWEQTDLAAASHVSVPTIKRLEGMRGEIQATDLTISAIVRAFNDAGVEFTNGDGAGVRLRGRQA